MAAAAPARARPKPAFAPEPVRRERTPSRAPVRRPPARERARLAGSVAWITLVALLLTGIVAVNVAALRLNLESQRLEERKEELLGANAAAASELSGLASAGRIEDEARRLGLAPPAETKYVRARARGQ